MLTTFVAKGDTIPHTPASAVDAGDIVVVGSIVGHAPRPIAAGELGALTVEGIVRFPMTAISTDLPAGTKVWWDAGNEVATPTASSHKVAGYTAEVAVAGAETVAVKLARA